MLEEIGNGYSKITRKYQDVVDVKQPGIFPIKSKAVSKTKDF